jgi:hypothetical protein
MIVCKFAKNLYTVQSTSLQENSIKTSPEKIGIWSSIEFLWRSIGILHRVLWNSIELNGDFYGAP